MEIRGRVLMEVADLIRSAPTGPLLGALSALDTETLAQMRRTLLADHTATNGQRFNNGSNPTTPSRSG